MELACRVRKRLGSFSFQADFRVHGSRVGVFGPSGSGKSTLMLLLAGLLKPDEGRIVLDDRVLYDREAGIDLPPERRRIGVVFQHARLFPHLNVRSNLLYGYRRTPRQQRCIQPEDIVRVLALEHLLDRGVNLLSGGERQRVALGRTVLACPRLILMDEPLTGLDEHLKRQIIPYLNEVSAAFALPLLFISHSLMEMRLMTEQTLNIEDGRVTGLSSTEELAQRLWGSGRQGYSNVLHLGRARKRGDLYEYDWGGVRLVLTEKGEGEENVFALEARDVLLFKKNPQATSARNLLRCQVTRLSAADNRVLVELRCGSQPLVVQIVPESVRELELAPGVAVVAAIKASSFRRLA